MVKAMDNGHLHFVGSTRHHSSSAFLNGDRVHSEEAMVRSDVEDEERAVLASQGSPSLPSPSF